MYKKLTGILLCLTLLITTAVPVFADTVSEETREETTAIPALSISSPEAFLAFAENCRLDVYSKDLLVSLEADIDLKDSDFNGIPIFSGIFDGNGHRITGLNIRGDGSMQGLFRHLTDTAIVQNLSVSGTVQPGGSRNEIGAIAGRNEGRILNCSFQGTVSGSDHIGGLAGSNGVTGVIENCHAAGEIHGNHFVGGIAGKNRGVIRGCTNSALINTTPLQNSIELSDITLDTLTNTESVNTVTDVGGIAGISSGVIRSCRNLANVGYQHMGYNIGGIAGTQSGYVVDCENLGNIQGRKETGGIVGQMEPASLIEYSEDALQILQEQLNTMSGLVNQASGNAQANANNITGQIGILQDQAETARDAVDILIPDPENPELPDSDTILAAQSTLSGALSAMPGTLNHITSATQTTLSSLIRDLNAISGQISAMGQTINHASDNLGGTIADISDADTPELLTGKIENCKNSGNVLADLNVGGIAGAMAMENDLDILEDWQQHGDDSLNFSSEVRAVILNCQNSGTITGKKQNAGGIAGWQSLGLVKDCANTGVVDGSAADYVGGISGLSTGYIRSGFVKCEIHGKTYTGGIAGSGTIVTDSLAQVKLLGVREKKGAIMGYAEHPNTDVENPVHGNYYLRPDSDPGAIDGISYAGLAEPMAQDVFLHQENLPDIFQSATLRFLCEDGTVTTIVVTPGADLSRSSIPEIPEKDGFSAAWKGLEDAALRNILFDMTFEAVYTAHVATIQSQQTRGNGLPLLLAEGAFTSDATVQAVESKLQPIVDDHGQLLEIWEITVSENADTFRLLLPDGVDTASVKLLASDNSGVWSEVSCHTDGSYLVFPMSQTTATVALVAIRQNHGLVYIAALVSIILLAALGFRKKRRRSGKRDQKAV